MRSQRRPWPRPRADRRPSSSSRCCRSRPHRARHRPVPRRRLRAGAGRQRGRGGCRRAPAGHRPDAAARAALPAGRATAPTSAWPGTASRSTCARGRSIPLLAERLEARATADAGPARDGLCATSSSRRRGGRGDGDAAPDGFGDGARHALGDARGRARRRVPLPRAARSLSPADRSGAAACARRATCGAPGVAVGLALPASRRPRSSCMLRRRAAGSGRPPRARAAAAARLAALAARPRARRRAAWSARAGRASRTTLAAGAARGARRRGSAADRPRRRRARRGPRWAARAQDAILVALRPRPIRRWRRARARRAPARLSARARACDRLALDPLSRALALDRRAGAAARCVRAVEGLVG